MNTSMIESGLVQHHHPARDRVAVFATDIYTRMRRLQTIRSLGIEPRPYSRMQDLIDALHAGRHFKMVLAVIEGSAALALRKAEVLRYRSPPSAPFVFLWAPPTTGTSRMPSSFAEELGFLSWPLTELELRSRIAQLIDGSDATQLASIDLQPKTWTNAFSDPRVAPA
ncbi:hypothetical protein [Variovorax sp. Sphag1AA]|uniref:hypothetical protein n=1 Tax=Variovorax sp. Sphag1AA TaxID=2587027 RepID=UPI00160DC39E|nr:hypothetical protein [Variovorax sp. Sphag1AA]MBB3179050.1 hypothetical protein [Variovorax sp. Sphag1AA]